MKKNEIHERVIKIMFIKITIYTIKIDIFRIKLNFILYIANTSIIFQEFY